MKIPIVLVYNGTYCSVASNNVMFDVVYWIKLCYHFMEGGIAWHAHPKMSMVLFAIDFIVEWVYDHVIIYDYENFLAKELFA